jgi:hypothetical protein
MKESISASGLTYFLNPFWRKFVGSKTVVVNLSEPEHRMRDARTVIALRQFLPPEESGLTTYRTVTVGGREAPHWPDEISASPDTGVIIVGRPALFGEEALSFLDGCEPSLVYSFQRNNCPDQLLQTRRDYRAIVAPLAVNRRFQSELFDESRRREPRPSRLKDLGIVYSGWRESRPVVVFGGSSTVSTWGCAVWSTQAPGIGDLRWHQDVQGIIEASVVNTPRAFQTVQAEVHDGQMLTPVSIWMDGPDLPPPNAWKEALSGQGADSARIRILANGKSVFRPQGYMIPLVLIAWMNLGREEHRTGILRATCTTAEVLSWIDAFLGRTEAMGPRATVQSWVNGIMNDAVRYLNEVGGLATIDGSRPTRFTLWFREPARFLPVFRI